MRIPASVRENPDLHAVAHQSSWPAQPVDDVEGVEEALRRLWVKEGSKVTVGVNLLQALLDLRICVKEEEDLPESSRHDQGFWLGIRLS